ncbi:MAG: hypothetical protein GY745_11870 [Actinomycetia bacterium]|nr:hypothetical protein [Actinomycetes bacterium]MCP4085736.1 hypothetical protein [Actinomycetes bacterium]
MPATSVPLPAGLGAPRWADGPSRSTAGPYGFHDRVAGTRVMGREVED